jgi:hypothetical protein
MQPIRDVRRVAAGKAYPLNRSQPHTAFAQRTENLVAIETGTCSDGHRAWVLRMREL